MAGPLGFKDMMTVDYRPVVDVAQISLGNVACTKGEITAGETNVLMLCNVKRAIGIETRHDKVFAFGIGIRGLPDGNDPPIRLDGQERPHGRARLLGGDAIKSRPTWRLRHPS